MTVLQDELKRAIRTIPDYPHEGIMFRDITTLIGDPVAYRKSVDALVYPFTGQGLSQVAGIDARGFIFGGAMAHQLSTGFLTLRKKGKLPFETYSMTYKLEYGEAELEIHKDAIKEGERVVLVDDLIATGGTAEAAIKLLRNVGADVVGASFVVDLPDLGGRKKLEDMGIKVRTLVEFEGE